MLCKYPVLRIIQYSGNRHNFVKLHQYLFYFVFCLKCFMWNRVKFCIFITISITIFRKLYRVPDMGYLFDYYLSYFLIPNYASFLHGQVTSPNAKPPPGGPATFLYYGYHTIDESRWFKTQECRPRTLRFSCLNANFGNLSLLILLRCLSQFTLCLIEKSIIQYISSSTEVSSRRNIPL